MPKILSPFPPICASFVLILQIFTNIAAQDEIRIRITADKQVSADIRGNFTPKNPPGDRRDIWFLDQFAGVAGLHDRRSIVYFYDNHGYLIAGKRFTGHEHVNGQNMGGFWYTVDLTPRPEEAAAAHVSWANGNDGLLILDDLLPQSVGKSAKVKIEVPVGWKVYSTERSLGVNEYEVADIEKAVFVLGRNWREMVVSGSSIKLLISGEWLFTDNEAAKLAGEIAASYRMLFGSAEPSVHLALLKFPIPTRLGNWEAGSRGRNITIASSDMPFKSQSLQRLHEQLRHEIFHIWIPNSVNLPGDYDWFYEGFALYQSLKLGVAVNRIRFEDMLDTLSRAYNIDSGGGQRMSLIVASGNRWNGANTGVYARGMLVAFLCDLALLDASKGKVSSNDLLRKFYADFRGPNPGIDGNAAIIGSLYRHKELRPMVDRYITASEVIEWRPLLSAAGLEAEIQGQVISLKVVAKPSGRQRDLLDKLGYNSWRKTSNGNK